MLSPRLITASGIDFIYIVVVELIGKIKKSRWFFELFEKESAESCR